MIDAGTKRLLKHLNRPQGASSQEGQADEKISRNYSGACRECRGDRLRHQSLCRVQQRLQRPVLQQWLQQPAGRTRSATGAVGGAVAGGVAGAVIPGVSVGQGAIAGAILGGVLGAVVKGRQYYRDTRGYCYYVDQYGRPIYDYNTRC